MDMWSKSIEVIQGDITKLNVDIIVNAANTSLLGGGGVDGAIHRGGGKAILEECMKIRERQGGCPAGEAVITSAGKLPAKYVIHAVGPKWFDGNRNEETLLRSCYRASLSLAVQHNAQSIAFPNISTGIYGFPKVRASDIVYEEITDFLKQNNGEMRVLFVCFDNENFNLYKNKFYRLY